MKKIVTVGFLAAFLLAIAGAGTASAAAKWNIKFGHDQPEKSPHHDGALYFKKLVEEGSQGEILGYICYGKAPLTDAVYDLYWIVVHPDYWSRGPGSALLLRAEDEVKHLKARLLLIETSSLSSYARPRSFYLKHGYRELARVPDYYAVGDHKLIFGKTF